MDGIRNLAVERGGPVATAVVLALISAPIVAWSFQQWPAGTNLTYDPVVPPFAEATLLVLVTAIPVAALTGWLGGWIRRRRRVLGAAVALVTAWTLGIAAAPFVANLLGIPIRTVAFCFDSCSPIVDGARPADAAVYLVIGWIVVGFAGGGLFVAGAAAAAFVATQRFHRPTLGVVLVTIAFGILNFLALVPYGLVAYPCLAVGIVAWDHWLDARDRALVEPQTPASDPLPA